MTIAPPRPLKRLGQNFLTDPNIVRKILSLAAIQPGETVFEIGPGRGVLTVPLCERASEVIAIELDQRLVSFLSSVCQQCGNLTLHSGDALDYAYDTLPEGTVVVANLPYYVSTPILFRLLESRDRVRRMVLMLQLEVAKRLTAKPGTKDYGALSVLCQYSTDARLAFKIPATCFYPQPDVESAVVTLLFRPLQDTNDVFVRQFIQTVRAAFAHRRKTLVNSFKDAGWSDATIRQALAVAGIDPTRRAETVTVQEFTHLAHALQNAQTL